MKPVTSGDTESQSAVGRYQFVTIDGNPARFDIAIGELCFFEISWVDAGMAWKPGDVSLTICGGNTRPSTKRISHEEMRRLQEEARDPNRTSGPDA